MKLQIKKLHPDAQMPKYQSDGAAGLDLYAYSIHGYEGLGESGWDCKDENLIRHGDRRIIKTGVSVAIPPGYVGLIWDRGGMAKEGFHTMAGVVDSDYRGEVLVMLHNVTRHDINIEKGQRIAQILIVPCPQVEIEEVDELSDTERGDGRFGSTGR